MHRKAVLLPDCVPQRELNSGEALREVSWSTTGAVGDEAQLIATGRQALDVVHGCSDNNRTPRVDYGNFCGVVWCAKHFTDARHPCVGLDFHEHDLCTLLD